MPEVLLRAAQAGDADRIVQLTYGEPSAEAVALAGSQAVALTFGRLLSAAWPAVSWRYSVVAVADDRVVGVLQHGDASDDFRPGPLFALRLIAGMGLVTAARALPRGMALQRVRVSAPPGSWVVNEVHVDAAFRGSGIGGRLMDVAEHEARRRGYRTMALTTRTNNPARRLYERLGFLVVQTRTDSGYERYTGAAGRVLMVKTLA